MALSRVEPTNKPWTRDQATGAGKPKTPDKARGVWKWIEEEKGKRWVTPLIPDGDAVCARVQRSFSKDPIVKDYVYYVYRNAEVWGRRNTPEEAMKMAEKGKSERNKKDAVSFYLDGAPGDMPAFLALTEAERRYIRQQYPYAVPRVKLPGDAPGKPGARVVAGKAKDAQGEAAEGPRGGQKAALEALNQKGVLERLRDGNPKKAGSGAFTRWELMFKHCAEGSTVAEFLKAGGNPETLQNAVRLGFAAVRVK